MIDVYAAEHNVGQLFRANTNSEKYVFGYVKNCEEAGAVSLTMPVSNEQYQSESKVLHPIFDMNLPEGFLADKLRRDYAKVISNFDSLGMLSIVGRSQIGRLRYSDQNQPIQAYPTESIAKLLAYDGAEGLFASLLERYARSSGVLTYMPMAT